MISRMLLVEAGLKLQRSQGENRPYAAHKNAHGRVFFDGIIN
jgi:hypothetical protein